MTEHNEHGFQNLQNAVINSKSGPFSDDDGELRQSDGGLASGVHPVAEQTNATWIHLGGDGDEQHLNEYGEMEIPADYTAVPVFFDEKTEDEFYYDVSNKEVWPVMHDMVENHHTASEESWESYKEVNQEFGDKINEYVENGDPVWIHDYQNMLVPETIRSDNDRSPITYTHHIPIPDIESFEQLTHDRELLEGLSATDVIGVHTDKDRENLLDIAEDYGAEIDEYGDKSTFELDDNGETIVTDVPLGIDHEAYSETETNEINKRKEIAEELGTSHEDLNLMFAPARADYTKGLDRLIDAYEEFQENSENAGNTQFILKPMPTRGSIDEYAELWDDITTRGEENEGITLRTDWVKHDELVELYRASDVIAAPSYRDGMNLVAKEGVAANATGDYKGTLLLGEGAGAAEQLGEEAILVDPDDPKDMAYMLEKAFDMNYKDRNERMASMNENVETYDVDWWTREYNDLAGLAEQLRSEITEA